MRPMSAKEIAKRLSADRAAQRALKVLRMTDSNEGFAVFEFDSRDLDASGFGWPDHGPDSDE